jgi:hypothetical protein
MKTKVFSVHTIADLEGQVNKWLEENPGKEVQFVAQSESDSPEFGWSITLTILYKETGS